MIEFIKMNDNELRELKNFAAPIWRECYDGIVAPSHIEILIAKYFDYSNICGFLKKGMIYEYTVLKGEKIGFIAYMPCFDHVYLDKLYFLKEYRGKRLSHFVFEYLSDSFKKPLRLNVNRKNERAVRAYESNGFRIVSEEELPQSGGFVNSDYVMERRADK